MYVMPYIQVDIESVHPCGFVVYQSISHRDPDSLFALYMLLTSRLDNLYSGHECCQILIRTSNHLLGVCDIYREGERDP